MRKWLVAYPAKSRVDPLNMYVIKSLIHQIVTRGKYRCHKKGRCFIAILLFD